tara:strand:- start:2864 stop:3655 length:792 start_codon:yes stop_codon:yes gene_type:complete
MAFGTVKVDTITSSTQTLSVDDLVTLTQTTANFTGTLQNGGSNVVVDSDIGSSVQAYDANLPAGNTILVDGDVGSNVQAYSAKLTAVAGLAVTDGNVIVGNGSTFVAENGATARTSLGVAIGSDVQAYDADTAKTDVAQTFSAAQTFTPQTIHNGGVKLDGPYEQVAEAVSALAIDLSTGNYFTKTISGNSTFTFTNPPASGTVGSFVLELTHTSGTVTWPSSVKFPADTAPTLTTGKTHLFFFVTDDGGTRYRGASLVDYVN